MKKETLEELSKLAKRRYLERLDNLQNCDFADGIFEGAKLMQERMYSEEDIHKIVESYQNTMENNPNYITYNQWFEQFKKDKL
jgi:hypothetical protein